MKRRPNKEARDKLAANILAGLRYRSYTIFELTEVFGFSHHAVRERLRQLLVAGQVHYVEVQTKGGLGVAHVWYLGAPPADQVERMKRLEEDRLDSMRAAAEARSIQMPTQRTVRAYPAINRRDPFVAALFGPARSETP